MFVQIVGSLVYWVFPQVFDIRIEVCVYKYVIANQQTYEYKLKNKRFVASYLKRCF